MNMDAALSRMVEASTSAAAASHLTQRPNQHLQLQHLQQQPPASRRLDSNAAVTATAQPAAAAAADKAAYIGAADVAAVHASVMSGNACWVLSVWEVGQWCRDLGK
jgi:hypothetical protein